MEHARRYLAKARMARIHGRDHKGAVIALNTALAFTQTQREWRPSMLEIRLRYRGY